MKLGKTAPAHEHRPAISKRVRDITKWGDYEPRKREPNEALPPENNLWTRPVYVPERDNRRDDRTRPTIRIKP